MQTWNATLPFSGLQGIYANKTVDLFKFTDIQYQSQLPYTSPIKFDSNLYPPTKEGL